MGEKLQPHEEVIQIGQVVKEPPDVVRGLGEVNQYVGLVLPCCKLLDNCRLADTPRPLQQQRRSSVLRLLPGKHLIVDFPLENHFELLLCIFLQYSTKDANPKIFGYVLAIG